MPITFLLAEDNYKHAATVAGYVAAVAADIGVPVNIVKAFRHAEIEQRIEELKDDPGLIICFDLQMERGEMVRIDDYILQRFSSKSSMHPERWALNVPIIVFSAAADDVGTRLKGRANTFVIPKIPRRGNTYDELKSAIRQTIQIVANRVE